MVKFNSFRLVYCNKTPNFTLINHHKINSMKKVLLLATAALLVTGISFADHGKKKKKCAKGKSCCTKTAEVKKSCCKDKSKTAKI